jgi:hypothetical protein
MGQGFRVLKNGSQSLWFGSHALKGRALLQMSQVLVNPVALALQKARHCVGKRGMR